MQNFLFPPRNFPNQEISRPSVSLFFAAIFVVLAGCGSGSGLQSTTSGSTAGAAGTAPAATTSAAATVQLLVSSPQTPSSGATAVDLTAVVLDANKQTVQGSTVTFSPGTDATAYISNVSGQSDASGVATAKLNLGTSKINRTIIVTAKSGSASTTNSVDVTGTAITVSGNDSLAFGASTTLTFSLKDSAGTPLPGIALSLASQNGNTIAVTPTTGITNTSGQISAVITATQVGNDVITVTGGGTSATKALTSSSSNFVFSAPTLVAPATTIDIPLTSTTVAITWNDAAAGGPQKGQTITFASSRGTVSSNTAPTDATGSASITVTSPSSSGPAIITASGPGGTPTASLNVVFVATAASSVTVQAVPSTIQVTTTSASQTTSSSTITAVVRDANNNVVKNAGVNFSVAADPSGGKLTSARAITDVTGSASVTYVAGTLSSPQNGVQITATVSDVNGTPPDSAITNTTALTVTGQTLFVRLGTDNTVTSSPSSTLLYVKNYIAIVTDSGGHPVPGADVRFVLRPGHYYKGAFTTAVDATFNADGTLKTPMIPAQRTLTVPPQGDGVPGCANEDGNFNGILDAGEDLNQNKQLDPGGIASVNPNATTDANGIVTASITYPKSHAAWVEVTLEARTGIAGNDPPATATFTVPIAEQDVVFGGTASHGVVSPYGTSAVCTNTL